MRREGALAEVRVVRWRCQASAGTGALGRPWAALVVPEPEAAAAEAAEAEGRRVVIPFTQVAQNEPPSARSVQHALDVLARLPAEALADLTERLADALDGLHGDPDLEAEEDRCEAEDAPVSTRLGVGDLDDAEPDVDDEPDADEIGEPPATIRPAWTMRRRPRGSTGPWKTVL